MTSTTVIVALMFYITISICVTLMCSISYVSIKTLLDDTALSVISSSYALELHAPGTIEQIARNSSHAIYDFVPSITRPPLLSPSTKSVDAPPSFSQIFPKKGTRC